eukprot:Seg4245.3 transcript_id=Seg4245.3/GoldUCD/mRNA.D3Y31 product="hypothetical protein" protein_id=Seg4245.3/GoldUCD/D3Y31
MAQMKKVDNSKSLESLLQSLKEQKEVLEKLTKSKCNTAHKNHDPPSTIKKKTKNVATPEDSSERLTRLAKEAWKNRQLNQGHFSAETASIPIFQQSPSKSLNKNIYKKDQHMPNVIKQPKNGFQPRNITSCSRWIKKPCPNAISIENKVKSNDKLDGFESRYGLGSKYSLHKKFDTESIEMGNKGNSDHSEIEIEKQLTLPTTKITNSNIASNCDKSKQSRGLIVAEDTERSSKSIPGGLEEEGVGESIQTNKRQHLLKDSSAWLSLLAKQTWQSSTSRRNHGLEPTVQIPPKSALKISRTSVLGRNQERNKGTRGHVKSEPCRDKGKEIRTDERVQSQKIGVDDLNLSKYDEKCGDESTDTTDDRLSALAKRVWQGKAIHQRSKPIMSPGRSKGKHKWRKDNVHAGTSGRRTQYQLMNSGTQSAFRWRSAQTGSKSFLQRRKSVILKQNRYKIVKVNRSAQDQKMKKKSENRVGLNVSWHSRYSLNKRRTSFVKRRQAFLSEHSHPTTSST